jgi:hypothetical protein
MSTLARGWSPSTARNRSRVVEILDANMVHGWPPSSCGVDRVRIVGLPSHHGRGGGQPLHDIYPFEDQPGRTGRSPLEGILNLPARGLSAGGVPDDLIASRGKRSPRSPTSTASPADPGDIPWLLEPGNFQTKVAKMKKIILMEMVLIGASILVFRSVWALLDSIAWASGGVGLAVLLVMGIVAAAFAMRSIEALSGKGRGGLEDG